MIKELLLEYIKSSICNEKKSCGNYWTNFMIAIGLIVLLIANYFYFFKFDREIGTYLAAGALLIATAFLIQGLSYLLEQKRKNKALTKIKTTSNELVNAVSKQFNELVSIETLFSLLPLIIRFVPISVIALVMYSLVKRKFLSKLSNLTASSK